MVLAADGGGYAGVSPVAGGCALAGAGAILRVRQVRCVAVLGTKLHVPVTRRPLVARPRLPELVHSGAWELPRLVLISAPAGFGTTTLLR